MLPAPHLALRAGDAPPQAAVLALDLGAILGWAGTKADGTVSFGTGCYSAVGREGRRYYLFKRWLTEVKNSLGGQIAFVGYEKINFDRPGMQVIWGQTAILLAWCEHHGIPYKGYTPSQIKKAVAGTGKATKQEVINAVRALGYSPATDHEADALACLSLTLKGMRG